MHTKLMSINLETFAQNASLSPFFGHVCSNIELILNEYKTKNHVRIFILIFMTDLNYINRNTQKIRKTVQMIQKSDEMRQKRILTLIHVHISSALFFGRNTYVIYYDKLRLSSESVCCFQLD